MCHTPELCVQNIESQVEINKMKKVPILQCDSYETVPLFSIFFSMRKKTTENKVKNQLSNE